MKKFRLINCFHIKLIAMVTMVFDHIAAYILAHYALNEVGSIQAELYFPFRIIGRFSFVLIALLIVEGILHTRNVYKYLGKLLGLSLILIIAGFIIFHEYIGNPIITLFLGGLSVYLLTLKSWRKLFSIVPLTFTILCDLSIIPIEFDYGIYGVFLIVGYYLCLEGVKLFTKVYCQFYLIDEELFLNEETISKNYVIACSIFLLAYNVGWYFINPYYYGVPLMDMHLQIYSLFALPIILLYNRKRGYNAPWFKYGCYLFFPLHLILIYVISIFI